MQHLRSLTALLLLSALAGCTGKPEAPAPSAVAGERDIAAVRAFPDQVQTSFNGGSLDTFMQVFTDDAMQLSPNLPDTVGKAAIREVYEDALAKTDIKVEFRTAEIEVAGDLAFERGTYTIHVNNKADGAHLADITSRHIHILRRQADGSWKTWRMMTNSAEPPPATR